MESHSEFSQLKVINVGRDGKRRYDPHGKQQLIEACLQPGVSVAGLALRHGVNANLLRNWVCKHQRKGAGDAVSNVANERPSSPMLPFVTVVTSSRGATTPNQSGLLPSPPDPGPTLPLAPAAVRLTVEMPNGVSLQLDCSGQDATLVKAMIETLGRCHVPSGR